MEVNLARYTCMLLVNSRMTYSTRASHPSTACRRPQPLHNCAVRTPQVSLCARTMSRGQDARGIASALACGVGIALGMHCDNSASERQRHHRRARMLARGRAAQQGRPCTLCDSSCWACLPCAIQANGLVSLSEFLLSKNLSPRHNYSLPLVTLLE